MAAAVLPPLPSRTSTPADFHRLPPTVPLLPTWQTQRIVGLLACQRDALLREVDATVLKIEPVDDLPVVGKAVQEKQGKGKGKGGKKEETKGWWAVETDDTVLFPEGGGQPTDHGTITSLTSSSSESFPVKHVYRLDLTAVHYLPATSSTPPLAPGDRVHLTVDWARRVDHIQQHTGQHLLTALLERLPEPIPTLSWSLTAQPAPNYVELPRAPTPEEIAQVQARANDLIAEGRKIWVDVDVEAPEGARTGRTLPDDYQGGVIRTICIDGVDRNTCCGTHPPSLSLLSSLFILPHTQSIRGTNVRLFFLTGGRVLSYVSSAHTSLRAAASHIGCAVDEVPGRVEAYVRGSKESAKRERALLEQLARGVVEQLRGLGKAAHLHREGEATEGIEFLALVSQLFTPPEEWKGPYIAAVTTPGAAIVFGSVDAVAKAQEWIKEEKWFSGKVRGGGGKGRWQGKVVGGTLDEADKTKWGKLVKDVIALTEERQEEQK